MSTKQLAAAIDGALLEIAKVSSEAPWATIIEADLNSARAHLRLWQEAIETRRLEAEVHQRLGLFETEKP